MPRRSSATSLAADIRKLVDQRREHQDAIDDINAILGEIGAAMGNTPTRAAARKPGRRRRGSFSVTGDQLIINFVKAKGKPTGRDIEQHWKSEGRGGFAANALSKLVKKRVLKREPIKDGRGSRYAMA